jgi:hypothetical protein
MFQFCEVVSLSFILKIAQSLGSEKLSETFKEILENNKFPSIQLIDAAIKLDYYEAFPYDDLRKMKINLSSNYLSIILLKRLVLRYLYMFPTKYDEKQKICSLMEVPIESTRLIDRTTTQRRIT